MQLEARAGGVVEQTEQSQHGQQVLCVQALPRPRQTHCNPLGGVACWQGSYCKGTELFILLYTSLLVRQIVAQSAPSAFLARCCSKVCSLRRLSITFWFGSTWATPQLS